MQKRNIISLVSGASVGQGLAFISLPLLTRLYSPESFGIFALYSSVCWIATVLATFQLEHAITIPKGEKSAANLLASMKHIGGMMAIIFGISAYYLIPLTVINTIEGISRLMISISTVVTIYLLANIQANRSGILRLQQYSVASRSTMMMPLLNALFAIVYPFLAVNTNTAYGLVVAQVFSLAITHIYLEVKIHQLYRTPKIKLKKKLMILRHYSKFAIKNTISNLLKTSNARAYPLLIQAVGNISTVGAYGIAERLILIPVSLVSNSVNSVFKNTFAKESSQKIYNNIDKTYKKIVCYEIVIAAPFVMLIYIYSELLTTMLLGEKWREVGRYCSILIVGEFFVFIVNSVEDMYILKRKYGFKLTIYVMQSLALAFIGILCYFELLTQIESLLWSVVSVKVILALYELIYFSFNKNE